ncbi:MAG: type II secretion system minor pseudopilin GspI [Betaproteobacteria bacterium]|nr:type II secretion system minor pseudopilin GspI [Betaproteobacteria bacterium]
MARRHCGSQPGFTLFEVLVALAIIAIALLAAMRAAGQGTSNVSELRAHLLAGWVAQNVLVEQRVRGDWPSTGVLRGTQSQGGIAFNWREEIIGTQNAAFRRVDIFVFVEPEESRSLARMTGFLVSPPTSNLR